MRRSPPTRASSDQLFGMGIMKLRGDDIAWREIDGNLVVLALRSSTYLTTNASGTLLMKQLAEERTLQQLVQALVDAYGIPDRLAQEDVLGFLAESEGVAQAPEITASGGWRAHLAAR